LILEYNGSDAWIAKHWGRPLHFHNLAMLAEETCLRNADLIVVVSEVLRDELVERGIEPSRIVCYPNCIDPVVFDPERFDSQDRDVLRRELGIAPEAVVATFVGTFGQWHGADVLANVICKVFGRSDNWAEKARLHFLLVGDGWRLPMVRQALSAGGCTGHHALTGLVPQLDTPRILAASDICLSPHVANEDATAFIGSPTKLFEYMAMAKAIVASDLDQIGQVLHNSLRVEALPDGPPAETDDRLAVLTPPGDADGVARAIRFLVEYPEWQSLLARNARREALSLFTWDRHVQKILAAYERSYAG
jgi:glycosyltransferase involved in cell wall biosynthesis